MCFRPKYRNDNETRSRVRVPSKGIVPERSEPVTKLKEIQSQLCTLHPDRGRTRNLSKLSKLNCGLTQRQRNQRAQLKERKVSNVLYLLDLGTKVL